MACAPSEDSDQPGHPHSLIRVFAYAQWVAKDPRFLHTDGEDSDQTGRMPRLIWIFAGRTGHTIGLVTLWLNCNCESASCFLILFRIAWWTSAGKELHSCCFTLCRLDFLFLSRMVSGEGSGIRLCRFLIIAFSSTLKSFMLAGTSLLILLNNAIFHVMCKTEFATLYSRVKIRFDSPHTHNALCYHWHSANENYLLRKKINLTVFMWRTILIYSPSYENILHW